MVKIENINNMLFKFALQIIKGTTVVVVSAIALFGIAFAITTFARAGSLTPPAAPAGTGARSGPTAMSAEAVSTYTLPNAAIYCYGLSAAAAVARDGNTSTVYTDWRLPKADEAAQFMGTITSANYIWTSTIVAATGINALIMNLSTGYACYSASTCGFALSPAYVRCVR